MSPNTNTPSFPTVFVDLDNVLSDFDTAACRAHGLELAEMEKHRTPGVWDLVESIGRALGLEQFTEDEFWEQIHEGGEKFWMYMEPLPWYRELIYVVERLTNDWYIATTPSRSPVSYSGKVRWLLGHFPNLPAKRIIMMRNKALLGGTNRILIDDREATLKRFAASGGFPVIFPTMGNRLYEQRHDPVSAVTAALGVFRSVTAALGD